MAQLVPGSSADQTSKFVSVTTILVGLHQFARLF